MTELGLKVLSAVTNLVAGAIDTVHSAVFKKAPENHEWRKPLPTDARSPCPMVNALANHGYLARDGKGISLAHLVSGCKEGINLGADASLVVGAKALQASTTGNFLTFNLDDLSKHGIIEHDGSLSRNDIASGDNHSFAPEIWAAVAAHFTAETISIQTAAQARKDRLEAAPTTNPEFNLTAEGLRFSAIETSLYLGVFGEGTEGNARTQWVRILFEEERLPFEEGYRRPNRALTVPDLLALQKKVEAASV